MKRYVIYCFLTLCLCSCINDKSKMENKKWWKETVFYEIYMPSYKDSNGDGYSDFKGMTEKLDYICSLGVKGIWLTPFLESPKVDNGYDVSDCYTVDATYGTLDDFKTFVEEAHMRDIKIIMDMVLNHTSTQSKWFKEARKSKNNPYRDYYIWRDKPNNWESLFGGSAWEFDTLTSQYYYHKFAVEMVDLNWQNPAVIEEVQKVLRYWLDMGVDGFRLDVINFLLTEGITEDNPMNEKGEQEHINDIDQKGIKKAMNIINQTVNEYDNRFLVGEIGSDKIEVLKQYSSDDLLDVVFNFNFGSIPEFSAQRIFDELESMEKNMTDYPTLFFGSHDMPRLYSRLANDDSDRAYALAVLMLTAKGVPFIYYGEEIGMTNYVPTTLEGIRDVQGITHYHLALDEGKSKDEALIIANDNNRDKSRSPMQWNADSLAGFSTTCSWIPVNSDYLHLNVKEQQKNINSMLSKYKKIIGLRNNEPVLQYGTYKELSLDHDCIHFIREDSGEEISVFINFGENRTVDIPKGSKILMGDADLEMNGVLIVKIPSN